MSAGPLFTVSLTRAQCELIASALSFHATTGRAQAPQRAAWDPETADRWTDEADQAERLVEFFDRLTAAELEG